MKVIDEKLDRLKTKKEPLRLQLVDKRGSLAGNCLCGKQLTGFYGMLCCGGYSLDDPLIIFHSICQDCIEGGREKFAKILEQLGDSWRKASERTSLLSKSVLSMPPEDWPMIKPDQEGM